MGDNIIVEHHIYWHDDAKTILVMEARGDWTWDEARAFIEAQIEWMAQVDHRVHTVFVLNVSSLLPHGNLLLNLRQLIELQHPNEDLVVFTGNNQLMRTLIGALNRAAQIGSITTRYRYADTLEDGLREVERYLADKTASA